MCFHSQLYELSFKIKSHKICCFGLCIIRFQTSCQVDSCSYTNKKNQYIINDNIIKVINIAIQSLAHSYHFIIGPAFLRWLFRVVRCLKLLTLFVLSFVLPKQGKKKKLWVDRNSDTSSFVKFDMAIGNPTFLNLIGGILIIIIQRNFQEIKFQFANFGSPWWSSNGSHGTELKRLIRVNIQSICACITQIRTVYRLGIRPHKRQLL